MASSIKVPDIDELAFGRQEVAGLVSVIIPAYNSAKHIDECLQSVFNQTYSRTEIVVVDDGSVDSTREVLAPYIWQGKIKYLYQANQGPAAARNLALRNSIGEFVAFVDADDVWLPQKLEKQIAILTNNEEVGMVYSDSEWFGEEGGRRKEISYENRKAEYFRRGRIYNALLGFNFIPTMSVVVRRSILKKTGLFLEEIRVHRFSFGEDLELWLRIARICNVEFTPEKLVKRRIHPAQITANKRAGYRQLCFLYRYLLSQDIPSGKALIARKYLENTLKRIIAGILRM